MRIFLASIVLIASACQVAFASDYVTRVTKKDGAPSALLDAIADRPAVYVLNGGRVEVKLAGDGWREADDATLDQMSALTIESGKSSVFVSQKLRDDAVLRFARKSSGESIQFRVKIVMLPR